jgi:hypothetical protein
MRVTHPAVERSLHIPGRQGLTASRTPRVATQRCSWPSAPRASLSLVSSAFASDSSVCSRSLRRLLRLGSGLPVRGGDRSCRVPLLLQTSRRSRSGSHLVLLFRSSALRSFRLSPAFFTTMASADFPMSLNAGISLGQCRPFPFVPSGSTCSVNDSWASRVLVCSPPVTRLTARSCSYGRRFALGPFTWVPCGSHLTLGYGCRHLPRRGPFTPIGSAPARHTSADFSPPELRMVK